MLALRSAPVAIRLALAALTLLLALYAAELVFGFLPGVVGDPFMKFVVEPHLPGRRGALRRARPPRPGRARRVAADGPRRAGVGPRAALLHASSSGISRRSRSRRWPTPATCSSIRRSARRSSCSTARASAAAAERSGSTAPSARSRSARSAPRSCSTRCWTRSTGRASPPPPTSAIRIADVVMLGLVVGVLAMTGWRKAGAWALDRRRAGAVRRLGQPLLLRHRASAPTRKA